jgi:uncharacterized protein
MRRTDREVSDHLVIESVFNEADVCRVAFADNNTPYIVTLNFGFLPGERNVLYFHCAPEGRKIEMLHRNDLVCFTLDTGHQLFKAEKACGWGMKFRSVVGYGRISVVENDAERRKALGLIMDHYGGDGVYDFNEKVLADTKILRLDISELTCKEKK